MENTNKWPKGGQPDSQMTDGNKILSTVQVFASQQDSLTLFEVQCDTCGILTQAPVPPGRAVGYDVASLARYALGHVARYHPELLGDMPPTM